MAHLRPRPVRPPRLKNVAVTDPHLADCAPLPKGWYDISPLISPKIAVFPGDTPFSRRGLMAFERGDHLALSTMETTLHLGAHTDAPCHYAQNGATMEACPVQAYIGDAQVIGVTTTIGGRIAVTDLRGSIVAPRVLLRTLSYPDPNVWTGTFSTPSVELVHFLADSGVRLIGIDTPSIDPATAKELIAHHAVYARGLAVLEGIVLHHVPDGVFTLLAQPLPLVGADASPVRALLVPRQPNLETAPLAVATAHRQESRR